ncbi:MAG: hypothetical protein IPP45_11855 [Sphingomonadales bacterium]|nr:hypothetical protein [Sphingomonadales bacterium]
MHFLNRDDAVSEDESSSGATRNYFIRHWNGDLSLPISYWVNLILFVGLGAFGLVFLFALFENAVNDLRIASFGWLMFWPLVYGLWVWAVVGVWRSATNHVHRSGPSGWATVAKAMVILSAFSTAAQMTKSAIPQMLSVERLRLGMIRLGKLRTYDFAENGTSIEIHGVLSQSSRSLCKTSQFFSEGSPRCAPI